MLFPDGSEIVTETEFDFHQNSNMIHKSITDLNDEFNDSLEMNSLAKCTNRSTCDKKSSFDSLDNIEQDSLECDKCNVAKPSKKYPAQNNSSEHDCINNCTVEKVLVEPLSETNCGNSLHETNINRIVANVNENEHEFEHEYEFIDLPGKPLIFEHACVLFLLKNIRG